MPTEPDTALPVLPSRDLAATVAFYERLGFSAKLFTPHFPYAIVHRGTVELHFFGHPDLVPAESSAGCYIRVGDAAAWHRSLSGAGLPRTGLPRLTDPEAKPWGLLEFALVDADGNLVRIGQPLT